MIYDNLQPLLNWLNVYPSLTYFIIFLLSLSESLVIVGLIVPGIAIMTIIGTLVGAGYLSFWPIFIVSILGAIIGDGLSYWIGQKFQQQIRMWWIFRRYPEIITRCEKFFNKHGGKSVVFGRFVGPIRPMIPAVAGMMKMPPQYFYVVNIISAFLWAPVYLLPGIIFGTSLSQLPPEVNKKIISLLIIILFSMWIASKLIKSLIYYIRKRVRKFSNKLFLYAENNSLHLLQKIIKHPLTHKKQQADTFLFLIILLIITILFIVSTNSHSLATSLNPFFKHLSLMVHTNNSDYNNLLLTLYNNCNITILLLSFISILGYLAIASTGKNVEKLKNNITIADNNILLFKRTFILTTFLLISFFVTFYFITKTVAYPSPFELNYNIFYYSFPNLNIGLLSLLLGFMGIIKYCNDPIKYKYSSFNLCAVIILTTFIFLSLYLGYAWVSDILGALLISSCLLLVFCIIYWQAPLENLNFNHFYKIGSIILSLIILVNSSVFYFYSESKHDILSAHAHIITSNIDYETWQTQPEKLFESTSDPIINIHWLDTQENITKILADANWHKHPDFNFTNLLKIFKNHPDIEEIPLRPKFYQDNNARINFSKFDGNNKLLNIRLWQSEYKINNKTLWIGTVELLKPIKYLNLFTTLSHWPRAEFANSTEKLSSDLKKFNLDNKIITSENKFIDEELKIILVN